jgi:small subunit ribosomal protein S8
MVTDALSDAIIRIKNGYMARKAEVVMPKSKLVDAVCKLLVKNKYLADFKDSKAVLLYNNKVGAVTDLDRVSKPGLRIYVNKNNIPLVVGGKGLAVISTPAGLMTDKDAKGKKLGGELLFKVW